MSDYVLLTDSSADLTAELVAELGVEVLPLSFHMGDKTYRNWPDNREIDPKDFYRRLRAGETATTSAVNVSDYTEAVEPLVQAGRDVLIIAFSSGLSATCHSAQIAAQELSERYPDRKIWVVDSLCASLGQGLLVWYAARMKAQGKSMEEVRDWLEDNKLHLCHWFTVDDLHFLKRGGRISPATAVVGTMLSIKPVMHVDDEGRLVKVGTARGRNASLKALVNHMEETAIDSTTWAPSSAPTPAPAPWPCSSWGASADGGYQVAGGGAGHHRGGAGGPVRPPHRQRRHRHGH